VPLSPFIDNKVPEKPGGISLLEENGEKLLVWLVNKDTDDVMNAPHRFVVYRFAKGETVDTKNPAGIVAMTAQPYYRIPASLKGEYTFVVTVLDRVQNESAGVKCKVKL
jgi:hypothetical protein